MDSLEISLDHENKIVRVTATGQLNLSDGESIITEARTTAGKYRFDIIYDIRNASTVVPFADWFHLPRKLPVFKEENARSIKAAILASPEDKALGDLKFYETVTYNLGFKLRVFFDENEAIAWLLQNRTK